MGIAQLSQCLVDFIHLVGCCFWECGSLDVVVEGMRRSHFIVHYERVRRRRMGERGSLVSHKIKL